MSRHLDKSRAITFTRLSQVGFVILACGAGAVAYVGLPLAQPPTDKDFVVDDAGPVEAPQTKQEETKLDIVGSASRFARLSNAPKAAEIEQPVSTDKPPEVAEEPGLSDVKYLGFANVGSLKMALLNVNSKQRFVREGQLIDAERVKTIAPDAVTLGKDDTERRIPLEERTGERITRVRATPGTVANGIPQAPPVKINGVQPPRPIGEGIRGLSHLPDEYMNWTPAYQRRFDRVVNGLLQQSAFPDEFSLVEKAKAALLADGIDPDNKDSLMKLEEEDKAAEKLKTTGDYKKEEK